MTRVRAGSLMVVGALAGAVLAGCDSSADADPTSSPSTSVTAASPSTSAGASESPSSSPSPSPSDTGPDIPAAARKQTDAGAEAFVKYFFDQFNVAWTKPQPGLIKSLSDPECQFCKKTEDTAQYLDEHEQRYGRDPAELESVQVFGGAPEGEQYTDVRIIQQRAPILDKSGDEVTTDPRKVLHYYVTLRWTENGWRLLELEKTK